MTHFLRAFALLILLAWSHRALAAIGPSFSLKYSGWIATDIVVVTKGETIDGNVTVLETWKGNSKQGDKLSIPELAAFAPPEKRAVSKGFGIKNEAPTTTITGEKLVLFLRKSNATSETWKSADRFGEMVVSLVWVEQNKIYGIVRVTDKGADQGNCWDTNGSEQSNRVEKSGAKSAGVAPLSPIQKWLGPKSRF